MPTDFPEADGTLTWDATTLVLVQVSAAGHTGIGWTYADAAIVALVQTARPASWRAAMPWTCRCMGRRCGVPAATIGSTGTGHAALSAVEIAM